MTKPDIETLIEALIYASKNTAYAEIDEDRGRGGGQTARAEYELVKAKTKLLEAISVLEDTTDEPPRQV